ncbi:unnamed protein product [Eruca vesicaria subsp. sativa]|uniref:Uncharacterized protein n=1 Tax=Eruca vesicaria subsp. sativa TaxID=29727 RepID=A0ABC8J5J4_ERUVS|nr:unnamed protein product [Eruca vesicaria subsp. sativa]
MTGKKKRHNLKPTTSRVAKRPSSLPPQYDFIPTDASQSIPPVLPRSNNLPSVRDYPPPKNLFPTTTFAQSPLTPADGSTSKPQQPQQRQTQSTENINPRPPSQVPPARASQVW